MLGYADTVKATKAHCKCPKILRQGETPGLKINPRGMTIIPEGDLYRLTFNSKLPAAERFEAWVTEDVLPTIRKTGVTLDKRKKEKTVIP